MFVSTANNVTESDLQNLQNYTDKQRAIVIYLYLVGENGKNYNLQEVAKKVFNIDDGRQVSSICRCYNIGEQTHRRNSGIYSLHSEFCKKYGQVTLELIQEFVAQYPNGCYLETNIEDFIIKKVNDDRESLAMLNLIVDEGMKEIEDYQKKENEQKQQWLKENRERLEEEKERKQKAKIEAEVYEKKVFDTCFSWVSNALKSHKLHQKNEIISINEIVLFGKYYLKDESNIDNNKSDIPWIVLDKIGNNYLLMSQFALAKKQIIEEHLPKDFGMIYYKDLIIRKWLNDDFYNDAFSEIEKENIIPYKVKNEINIQNGGYAFSFVDKIKKKLNYKINNEILSDKVFVLSIDELKKYSGNNYNNLPCKFSDAIQSTFDCINNYENSYLTRSMERNGNSIQKITFFGGLEYSEENQIINDIPKEAFMPYDCLEPEKYNAGIKLKMEGDPNIVGVRPSILVKEDAIL